MSTWKTKHILIAPLDWGLGHTARCVPIIRHIQSLGHIPIVACNPSQRSFIEESFGHIDIINLGGYNITYSAWNRFCQIGLLSQLPRVFRTINKEHEWLLRQCPKIDGIISDNRYGLFLPGTPSVIITHQLQVQTGLGGIADRAVQCLHNRFLNRFDATWVVDTKYPNLGGKLSHTRNPPRHSEYIGLLSRFGGQLNGHEADKAGLSTYPLVILLSGPEPQRTRLSAILWRQAIRHKGEVIFIEGSDNAVKPADIPPHITYYKRLAGPGLAPILRGAGTVVCRSGYSTLMDLVALGKKAIVIPTPGQTEQERLGKSLHCQGVFYCAAQHGFDLENALMAAVNFPFNTLGLQGAYNEYKGVLEQWVSKL